MGDRIEKKVELKAPISKVWKAISNPSEFGEWFRVKFETPFIPGQVCKGRLTYPGYEHYPFEITVREMKPEYYFSFNWHPYAVDLERDYSSEKPTLVELRLKEVGEATVLSIVESGFEQVPQDRREEAFQMNEGGWSQQIENIKAYVEELE
jgi:uncharacterized protein YndB with AHSA1/START domain